MSEATQNAEVARAFVTGAKLLLGRHQEHGWFETNAKLKLAVSYEAKASS